MKLTEDNLPIGFFDEFESYYFIGKFDDKKEAEQLKQQIQKDYQIRKVVEMRLDMAKTLKDDYMIQLFTDILRGR